MHRNRTLGRFPLQAAMADDLYYFVRSAFVSKKSSLAAWCRTNGVKRQCAETCLKGERTGPAAIALRDSGAAGIEV